MKLITSVKNSTKSLLFGLSLGLEVCGFGFDLGTPGHAGCTITLMSIWARSELGLEMGLGSFYI